MRGPISLLSSEKDFRNPWIGNQIANRLGLHVGRVVLADAFDRLRWAMRSASPRDRTWISQLRRDGAVAISDFLDPGAFDVVRSEVVGTIRDTLERFPPADNLRPGFGSKQPFGGGLGFDRFDGSTLNRFVTITPEQTPATLKMIRSERFTRLYKAAQGHSFPLSALSLYYTRHGSEAVHDLQKDLHSDTFHFTIKLWYFVEDVPAEAGPFAYVLGSNHSTSRRLAWEYRRSVAAASGPNKSGSFRVAETELEQLGYPQPTVFAVPANTLIIADTNGLHRRGDAAAGAERFSVYGGMRRSPFML